MTTLFNKFGLGDLVPFGKNRYTYTLLSYRPSLSEGRDEVPLAVIVQQKKGDQTLIWVVGAYRDLHGVSRLGRRILDQLPDWVRGRLIEAAQADEDALAYLAQDNPWNLRYSAPESFKARADIQQVAMQLFTLKVLGLVPVEGGRPPSLPGSAERQDFFAEQVPVAARAHA